MIRTDLTPLEIAAGAVVGFDPTAPALPTADSRAPREVLEKDLLDALERPPCCVSFSGGRDSSAVLAAAVHVARREGLAEPIPVTLRYPGHAEALEDDWQEMVVRHLDLANWECIEIHDELDYLGPIARDLLSRHGLLHPPNVQTMVPIGRRAKGGTVLTGWDGDAVFGLWRWRELADGLARRRDAVPRDALRLSYAVAPRRLRALRMRKREFVTRPWLTPTAERDFALQWIDMESGEPYRWSERLRWWARKRYLQVIRRAIASVGNDCGVEFRHPLIQPEFVSSLAAAGGKLGFGDRTRIMEILVGDLVPPALVRRTTKATFDRPFWGPQTRAFTQAWDGEGADQGLVDIARLKEIWKRDSPESRTASLARYFWLHSSSKGVEEATS